MKRQLLRALLIVTLPLSVPAALAFGACCAVPVAFVALLESGWDAEEAWDVWRDLMGELTGVSKLMERRA